MIDLSNELSGQRRRCLRANASSSEGRSSPVGQGASGRSSRNLEPRKFWHVGAFSSVGSASKRALSDTGVGQRVMLCILRKREKSGTLEMIEVFERYGTQFGACWATGLWHQKKFVNGIWAGYLRSVGMGDYIHIWLMNGVLASSS